MDVLFVIYSLNTDGTIKTVEVHSFQKRYIPERHYVNSIVYISCELFVSLGVHHLLVMIVWYEGQRGRDHMVVGFITTCAISAYHV